MSHSLRPKKGRASIAHLTGIVIIVVALVVVGGASAYYVSTLSSTNTTTSTSSNLTTTTSTSSSSSTTSTSTQASTSSSTSELTTTSSNSTTSTTSSSSTNSSKVTAASPSISSDSDLFGNFSQATFLISDNTSQASSSYNITLGYSVLGTVVNKSNNLPLTLVNFTVNGVVAGKNQSSSTLIYYNYTWSPLVVTQQGNNETGYLAQYAEFDETLYFNLMFSFGNTTMTAGALDNGTLLQSFGHLSMNVTTYTIPGVSVNGTSFTDMIFSVGQVPGTNLELVTYAYIGNEVISGQNYGTITLELVSATRS